MSTIDAVLSMGAEVNVESLAAAAEEQEVDEKLAVVNAVRQRKVTQAMSHQSFIQDIRAVCSMTGPVNDFISQLSYRTTILTRMVDEFGQSADQIARFRKLTPVSIY
jgi:hypothetical protein